MTAGNKVFFVVGDVAVVAALDVGAAGAVGSQRGVEGAAEF